MVVWNEIIIQFPAHNMGAFTVWVILSVVFQLYFFVLLLLHVLAFGVSWILKFRKMLILEVMLQCLSFTAIGLYIFALTESNNESYQINRKGASIMCVIFLVRCCRIIMVCKEIEKFHILVATLESFSDPFLMLMLSVYITFFTYS